MQEMKSANSDRAVAHLSRSWTMLLLCVITPSLALAAIPVPSPPPQAPKKRVQRPAPAPAKPKPPVVRRKAPVKKSSSDSGSNELPQAAPHDDEMQAPEEQVQNQAPSSELQSKPTAAQEAALARPQQTLEGAQQFLSELARRGNLRLFWGNNNAGGNVYNTWARFAITSVEAPSPCVIRVHYGLMEKSADVPATTAAYGDIDWTSIASVTATGGDFVEIRPSPPGWAIFGANTMSDSFAPRLATALEFIRSACDRTRNTGF